MTTKCLTAWSATTSQNNHPIHVNDLIDEHLDVVEEVTAECKEYEIQEMNM